MSRGAGVDMVQLLAALTGIAAEDIPPARAALSRREADRLANRIAAVVVEFLMERDELLRATATARTPGAMAVH